MGPHTSTRVVGSLLSIALVLLVFPARALAREQATPAPSPERRADFLFGKPHGTIGIRGTWTFAAARSDLFDFVTRELTLDRDDFNAPGIGMDAAFTLVPRVDVQAGFEYSRARAPSEYRDFVDNNELPIVQTTALRTVHLTGSIRYSLMDRGHEVSRFAWVPRRVVPFVGGGAGIIFYEFQQSGDFVDFVDLSVFPDVFLSRGWSPSVHAFAGLDVQVHRGLFAVVEARYTRASATLDRDFIDFDPIDLSGLRMSAGVNLFF